MNKNHINFLKRANDLYNNFYNYTNVIWGNSKTHITITCPVHGEFTTTPELHIRRQIECKLCKREKKHKHIQHNTTTKLCSNCNNEKPLDEFFKNKNLILGVDSMCKVCKTNDTKLWYNNTHEHRLHQLQFLVDIYGNALAAAVVTICRHKTKWFFC